jgi:hypothetical protein
MLLKPIIIFLVIITSLFLVIIVKNNLDKLDPIKVEEGFKSRKLERFRDSKKVNKNYIKGSRLDRIKHKEKMMDISSNTNTISAFDGITDTIDREDYTNIFNIHKKGSKASMGRVKSHLYDYYNKFDDNRFSRKSQSIIDSLGKWKYFKEEFYNIFEY